MLVTADSAGAITAARRSTTEPDGWLSGLVDLHMSSGEVVVSADDAGAVTLDRLGLAIEPITIPPTVIGHGATLTNVRVELAAPVVLDAEWVDDDEVHATGSIELQLSWSLTVDGSTSGLGSPHLPAVPVDVTITGDGPFVQSEVRIHAPGELWTWASLVKLEDLELILDAQTP
ncbi:MAG TPA: hypothetical protein VFQ53_08115 [Kofleriaceae bacterium]|nr:hypothetical protein [Kofleriaceae bacterium]